MSDDADGFGKVFGGAFGNAGARARTASSGSEILDAGQLLIAGMRLTTGWGRPDPGEAFGRGASGFTDAGQTVDSAYPRDDWAGTGSRTYASANRRQSGSAASLAVLDRDVQTVVAREAFQVDYHRGKLDDQSDHLSRLGYATWSLALIPGVGKALKAAVEMTAVNTALLVGTTELANLASETGENAAELRRLAEGYAALTRKTAPPPLPDEPTPPSDDVERRRVDEPTPGQPSAPEPGPSVGGASPAPAPSAPPAMHCSPTPGTEAAAAGQAAPSPAAADPMAAMSSVFGAVGGAIGSAVAPIAAALTGVVSAAGQALSATTSAQAAESTDVAPDVERATTDEDRTDEPAEPAPDDEPTTPAATAEPGAPVTAPPPAAEPPRAPAPAATRPPL